MTEDGRQAGRRKGGFARANALTWEQRHEMASRAANARWEKYRETGPQPKTTEKIDFSQLTRLQIEMTVDIGLRHKPGVKPKDYLRQWLTIARHFGFTSQDDTYGEFEKLFAIIIGKLVTTQHDLKTLRDRQWKANQEVQSNGQGNEGGDRSPQKGEGCGSPDR